MSGFAVTAGFNRSMFSHPAIAALLGSLLPTIASIVCVYLTYSLATEAQSRRIHLDLLARFDQSSSQIVDAGGGFLTALNNDKDLTAARGVIATLTGKQMLETESLRRNFGDISEIKGYENAIAEFEATAKGIQSPREIKTWAEAFGRVIDSKIALMKSLYNKLGITSTS